MAGENKRSKRSYEWFRAETYVELDIAIEERRGFFEWNKQTIVVARQIDKEHKCKYEVWNFNDFCDYYRKLPRPERHYHEMIYGSKPCRVYFDLEWKTLPLISLPVWDALLKELHELLGKQLKQEIGQPCIWKAHRKERLSCHVYYNVWLENAHSMKYLIYLLKTKASDRLKQILDEQVYPSLGSRKLLRLPYSSKFEDAAVEVVHPMIPNDDDGTDPFGHGPFQLELFCSSLVTCFPTENLVRIPIPKELIAANHQNSEASAGLRSIPLVAITKWLQEHMGVTKLYPTANSSNTFIIYPGVYCAAHNQSHTNNRTFITFHNRKRSQFSCPACKVSWPSPIITDIFDGTVKKMDHNMIERFLFVPEPGL
jgi:hypothetical protein